MVAFGVLGPLVASSATGPLRLKGPRHRAVLARLLIARGRVVPVPVLVDDLWENPPDGAVGALQTFVAALRKDLEPDRPPRTPSTLLVTEGAGYALRATKVDAWTFEESLSGSLSTLDDALALWRGPAYAEFADQHWARAEIARLDELRLVAVERRASAALAVGRAAEVAADLRAHVADHPWREDAWRLLALTLYRAGRQGDALEALREARSALVAGLGVDPGPELRQLETDILNQASSLRPLPSAPVLVGREKELSLLTAATGRFALVCGQAGAGKTALAEAVTRTLTAKGWSAAWGRSPEDGGAPAAWPWTQVLDALGLSAPSVDDRFAAQRAVVSAVDELARRIPVLIVLDDLQFAGEESLALLAAFAATPLTGTLLVLATFRPDPGLTDVLGRLARAEPTRVELTGLSRDATGELVRTTTDRPVSAEAVRQIHDRSGGNPFFARELARLFDAEGDLTAIPAGVRDVLRRRLTILSKDARTVLHQAAVIGRDVDLDLLIPLSGDEGVVLDALDSALQLGFLDQDGTRFAHALVRDTLYEDVSQARRSRWHAGVAKALERLRPDDVEALAHHYLRTNSPAAAGYAAAAALRAEQRFAPREAARLWQAALDRSTADTRTRLDLVTGLVRALAVSGDLEGARSHRVKALTEAEALSDPALTAAVIGAFDVPGIWTTNDNPSASAHVIAVTERTLASFDEPSPERARLLATLAMERRGSRRGLAEATEAESIARELDDPALLAFALNARFLHTCHRTGLAPDRAAIGRELVELAAKHGLVTYEVLGHLILLQAHSALAQFGLADEHAAAADDLGERHDLPLVGVFTEFYAALKLAAAGKRVAAEAAYRAAADRLGGTGMWGVQRGILPLALLSLYGTVDMKHDWGPYLDWVRPLALEDPEAALAAARALPDGPADLLSEVRACLLAKVALRLGDKALLARARALLEPAAEELAAGTGLVAFGPVSRYLADLTEALSC